MRYFNTYGPVNETQHYIVSRSELLATLVTQIKQGSYLRATTNGQNDDIATSSENAPLADFLDNFA